MIYNPMIILHHPMGTSWTCCIKEVNYCNLFDLVIRSPQKLCAAHFSLSLELECAGA